MPRQGGRATSRCSRHSARGEARRGNNTERHRDWFAALKASRNGQLSWSLCCDAACIRTHRILVSCTHVACLSTASCQSHSRLICSLYTVSRRTRGIRVVRYLHGTNTGNGYDFIIPIISWATRPVVQFFFCRELSLVIEIQVHVTLSSTLLLSVIATKLI